MQHNNTQPKKLISGPWSASSDFPKNKNEEIHHLNLLPPRGARWGLNEAVPHPAPSQQGPSSVLPKTGQRWFFKVSAPKIRSPHNKILLLGNLTDLTHISPSFYAGIFKGTSLQEDLCNPHSSTTSGCGAMNFLNLKILNFIKFTI